MMLLLLMMMMGLWVKFWSPMYSAPWLEIATHGYGILQSTPCGGSMVLTSRGIIFSIKFLQESKGVALKVQHQHIFENNHLDLESPF